MLRAKRRIRLLAPRLAPIFVTNDKHLTQLVIGNLTCQLIFGAVKQRVEDTKVWHELCRVALLILGYATSQKADINAMLREQLAVVDRAATDGVDKTMSIRHVADFNDSLMFDINTRVLGVRQSVSERFLELPPID